MGIVELWTLYALAVSFTCLRTYARITAVGLRELQVDDYLVWIAIAGLGMYTTRIYIAFVSIITSFVIIIFTIYLSCRPFWRYWQINPDPGNACQAAISKRLIWFTFVFNVSTDVYLLLIPIPMLWKSRLRIYKKIAAMLVLGAGMLVIDPLNSAELTASWGTRETFIAIFTTNLPMIFPLLKNWLTPFLPSTIGSSNAKGQEPPGSDFETIGGGSGPGGKRASRKAPHRARYTFGGLTLDNESEEDMIKGHDVAMHRMQRNDLEADRKNTIVVCSEVSVTSEDHSGVERKASFQTR
ncbi:uncharacterized protein J4E88_008997 [Alternaria novae-zelandiae]|uniref:uncharacterized protein n=1 Tax=Alternaria novae-zelandiae TaxID=430562 RepID=UPI0020C53A22|nr:uncharacterized protein J4E88_008997 [Alternaria novae-zelandiae]KAI4673384.1 hypothetical protein J4E88_008997 [Alternaria novae-zelandiae]